MMNSFPALLWFLPYSFILKDVLRKWAYEDGQPYAFISCSEDTLSILRSNSIWYKTITEQFQKGLGVTESK